MKRKKRKPMPKWIWALTPKTLNYKLKHLLAYFWWCGDKGCREWNYRIAKRFKCNPRTIRRWIKKLNDEHLIYINFPMKRSRTIYRRPYYTRLVWWEKSGQIKDLSKNSQQTPQPTDSRTEVSYISNAQRKKKERRFLLTPFLEVKAVENHDDRPILPSSAGGLGCSAWAEEKLRQLAGHPRATGATATPAPDDKAVEM